MDLLGNFWWWMASWQHGRSRGLGFCSYRPLFIPRCQSLHGNQLVHPSSPFLPLSPPSLSPQSSLLSLSWCKDGLPTTERNLLTQAKNQVGIGVSCWPGEAGCGGHREEVSAALPAGPALCRFQLCRPSWTTGPAWIGRTFQKPC